MVYLEPTDKEWVTCLKLKKKRLLKSMENCLGDLERWQVQKEVNKVEKELDKLLNK